MAEDFDMATLSDEIDVGNGEDVPYSVDVAMLIDAIGSMSSIIDETKANAKDFFQKFQNALEAIALAMRSEWDNESAGKHRHGVLRT